MKNLRIIMMVVMLLVTIFFIVLAQIQRGYAEEAIREAQKLHELSLKNEALAKKQEQIAVESAAMARIAESKAMQLQKELDACKN